MNKRTQTIAVLLPPGTAAGTYEVKDKLDSTYTRASGFAAYVNTDGGVPNMQLGLRNDGGVFASPTNIAHYAANASCPKNERLTPVAIDCDNQNLTVQLVLTSQLSSALSVDVVFQLEK